MWDCLPQSLHGVTSCLSDIICSDVRPLANSVLIQVMFSALYTKLLEAAKSYETPAESAATDSRPQTPNSMSKSAICTMLAEASCCIDEDNKHTDAIDELIKHAKYRQRSDGVQLEVDDENATESEVKVHLKMFILALIDLFIFTCSWKSTYRRQRPHHHRAQMYPTNMM